MKWIRLLPLLFVVQAWSQTTSVTLQVTDTDSQVWGNGTWAVTLTTPPGNPVPPLFKILGTNTTVPNQQQNGILSFGGGASLTLTPNTSIAPAGTIWSFFVCPQASGSCFTQTLTISGTLQTVTIAPPAIRISLVNPPPIVLAYADIEITNQSIGSQYFNLVTLSQRVWNGFNWASIGGTSVSNPTGTIAVAPTVAPFGTVQTGTTVQQVMAISNIGTAPIQVGSITFNAGGDPSFSLPFPNVCNGLLNIGVTCPFLVNFSPVSVASVLATLTVNSNAQIDPFVPNNTISLSGTGTAAATFPLNLNFAGTGSGTCTTDEATPLINATWNGVSISGPFSNNYASGATPTLTCTPTGGSTLASLVVGGTSCPSPCTVTVSAATQATATFTPPTPSFKLDISGAGAGNVTMTSDKADLITGQILNCKSTAGVITPSGGAGCSGSYTQGTVVRITENVDANSTFVNWSGISGCTTASFCDVTVNANTTITANATLNSTPISLAQTCTNASVASTTIACTWASAINVGDFLVVGVDIPDATTTVSSVTDNAGNTYTQVPTISPKVGTALTQALYYAQNTPAAAAGKVTTVTLSGAVPSISASNLTSGNSAVAGTTFTTASVTPASNNLVLITATSTLASGNGACAISSITGNSETYVKIASKTFGNAQGTGKMDSVELWRGLVASPTAGAITITYGCSPTNVTWIVDQISGTDLTGTNGSGAIGITASNNGGVASPATVTMGTFGSASNGTYGAHGGHGTNQGGNVSAGSGMTQLVRVVATAPTSSTEWATGNVSPVQVTWTGNQYWGIIGAEIKVPQNRRDVRAAEYSGILTAGNPVDVSAAAVGTSATAAPGTMTPGTTNDLITNFTLSNQSVQTAAAGFTQRIKNSFGDTMEDIEGADTSARNPSDALSTSGNWISSQVAFKPSGAPGPTNFALTQRGAGNGNGNVTSNAGTPTINCQFSAGVITSPAVCSSSIIPNSTVTLTAAPAAGSVFAGWSGITGCSSSPTCIVPNITSNQTATATFNLAGGQNFFVSPSGSDSNSGLDAAHPWLTINHADAALTLGPSGSCVSATAWEVALGIPTTGIGACVHLASGTYAGAITTTRQGAAATRIRYVSDSAQYGARLTGGSGTVLWTSHGKYTDVVGIDFDGSVNTALMGSLVTYAADSPTSIHVLNSKVHNFSSLCNQSNGPSALSSGLITSVTPTQSTQDVFSGNLVYHNNCGTGQTSIGSSEDGISTGWGTVVQNNIILDQGGGWCISASHGTQQAIITNNLVAGCDRAGILIANAFTVSDFDTVTNNIIVNSGGTGGNGGINVFGSGGCGAHNLYANNLMYGNTPGNIVSSSCTTTSANTQSGSNATTFVNYTGVFGGDYHSKAGSTAINNGTLQCASGVTGCVPPVDFDGNSRPIGPAPDIGPYEK